MRTVGWGRMWLVLWRTAPFMPLFRYSRAALISMRQVHPERLLQCSLYLSQIKHTSTVMRALMPRGLSRHSD